MIMRPFGTTGLTVSALGFGAGHIGDDEMTDREAEQLLDDVVGLGVTFVDTARSYGRSEERIGRWLSRHRDEVVLSTKIGSGVEGVDDWSPAAVTRGIDEACGKLGTDTLDVVFLHSCSLSVLQRGEATTALLDRVKAGQVRVAGYSGENAELAWAAGSGHFGALQTSVNLADQRSVRDVLPAAAEQGTGVVAKRPLANAPWRHASRPDGRYGETYWDRLAVMGLEPTDGDWLGTALRFSAFGAGVSTSIVGTGRATHLAAAAEALDRGPLDPEETARWRSTFDRLDHDHDWDGEV